MILQPEFNAYLDKLLPEGTRHLVIGLSGGVDSVVLTHLCLHYLKHRSHLSLRAVHIDHGINPVSTDWQAFCASLCLGWQIPFQAHRVCVSKGARISLEASARESRYKIYESEMAQDVALLLAQHGDDQVETLLLNLKRGSGLAGLAAMPAFRPLAQGWLIRPLLQERQQDILDYAALHNLIWVEDPSNRDCRFDRNFLRQEIIGQLEGRWPGFVSCVQRSAQLLQESQTLVDELAEIDFIRCGDVGTLKVQELLRLSSSRCHNLLRYWLRQADWSYPSQAQLVQIVQQLSAVEDAQPQVELNDGVVRRYRGRLYRVSRTAYQLKAMLWDMNQVLKFAGDSLSTSRGGKMMKPPPSAQVWVRFRDDVGNPDFFPAGRGGHRSLKKLLQELGFPPWIRGMVPLIYYDESLVAIGDRLIHSQWLSPSNQGITINWQTYDGTSLHPHV